MAFPLTTIKKRGGPCAGQACFLAPHQTFTGWPCRLVRLGHLVLIQETRVRILSGLQSCGSLVRGQAWKRGSIPRGPAQGEWSA